MKFVYIEWIDASYEEDIHDVNDMLGTIPSNLCGFLLAETDDTLSIAMEYYPKLDTWKHICHIPKCLIIKRVECTDATLFKKGKNR